MKNALEKAKDSKEIAAIIIGQVIVDEGYIGTDTIAIRYNSKKNARAIWNLANKWNWANRLQRHKYIDNRDPGNTKTAWRFTLKKGGIKEIYSIIGKLPEHKKDRKIRLVIRKRIGKPRPKGITRANIIREIKNGCTVEDMVGRLNLTRSTVNYHLKHIARNRNLKIEIKNGYGKRFYRF